MNNPLVGTTDAEIAAAVDAPLNSNTQKAGSLTSLAATKDPGAKTSFKGNYSEVPASAHASLPASRPAAGARLRAAAGGGVKVLGAVGVAVSVKDVYQSVKKGEYGRAAVTTGATALSFTPAAPVVLAAGVAMKYHSDPTIEQRAFAAGDLVQEATGSVVLGGLVAAGNAVGLSIYETGADFAHGVRNFFNDW